MSNLNPEPRTLNPSLPPSPRDFEIHRLNLVHHMSTWRLADKYEISQTRVRQIIKAVSDWLAVTLPAKTEAQQEQETRLAQHIAADQLKHQIEQLQTYFDGSGDPKYLRQQSRAILSLARLGIIPGSIEALAADAQYKPEAQARDSIPEPTDAANHAPPNSKSEIGAPARAGHLQSEIPSSPPSRDCSPSTASNHSADPAPHNAPATTPLHDAPSRQISFPVEDALAGLCVMEKRLLNLLDNTTHDDQERRESLQYSLTNIRHQKATLELRLSTNHPGATLTTTDQPARPHTSLLQLSTVNCLLPNDK